MFPSIFMIYNLSLCYTEWNSSHWSTGGSRTFKPPSKLDIYDNTNVSKFNGDITSSWQFKGDATMNMLGEYPRLYIQKYFYNTESTMYYRKDTTAGKDADGIIFGMRSSFDGHLKNEKINNSHWMQTHTYYTKIRHDGKVQICKEQIHRQNYVCFPKIHKYLYPDKRRLPINYWFGMKAIVANICHDKVLIQLWVDKTSNGALNKINQASSWELYLELIDSYGVFPSLNNDMTKLYNLDPNITFSNLGMVFIRNGFIKTGNSLYKYVSVREIELPEKIKLT